MSRLTTTEYGAFCSHINTPDCDNCEDCKWWLAIVEKLARYEDLEEQGRLIEKKCGKWQYGEWNNGHWVKGNKKVRCSECNRTFDSDSLNIWHYCPQCGCEMIGVEE